MFITAFSLFISLINYIFSLSVWKKYRCSMHDSQTYSRYIRHNHPRLTHWNSTSREMSDVFNWPLGSYGSSFCLSLAFSLCFCGSYSSSLSLLPHIWHLTPLPSVWLLVKAQTHWETGIVSNGMYCQAKYRIKCCCLSKVWRLHGPKEQLGQDSTSLWNSTKRFSLLWCFWWWWLRISRRRWSILLSHLHLTLNQVIRICN